MNIFFEFAVTINKIIKDFISWPCPSGNFY